MRLVVDDNLRKIPYSPYRRGISVGELANPVWNKVRIFGPNRICIGYDVNRRMRCRWASLFSPDNHLTATIACVAAARFDQNFTKQVCLHVCRATTQPSELLGQGLRPRNFGSLKLRYRQNGANAKKRMSHSASGCALRHLPQCLLVRPRSR